MIGYAIPLLLSVLVAGSLYVDNPEDMGREFGRAQRLLADGDLEGAQRRYVELMEMPDSRLLRASQVTVEIDQRTVPLQHAARYQLGNLSRQQARIWQEEADLAAPEAADSLAALARQQLLQAAAYFADLGEQAGFALRQEAQFLAMECLYQAETYADAAAAGYRLLELFPEGAYASRTRFNLGWTLYQLEEYAAADTVFAALIAREPHTIRADRARLQRGLALEQLGAYGAALEVFTELAGSYDPGSMSDAERTAVALAGLREGRSRRSLAARAWIKRGEMLAELGRYPEALAAYRTVGADFPGEEALVEQAWVRQAVLARQTEGADAAVAVYRYAGERAPRPAFRARMQAELMTLLFDEQRYAEALAAHRLYLTAHAEVADEAGLPVGEAHFRIAECLRLLGAAAAAAAEPPDTVEALFTAAIDAYEEAAAQVAAYLVPEALYWQGYTHQLLGQNEAARACFMQLQRDYPDSDLACRAILQQARLDSDAPAAAHAEAGRREALYQRILDHCHEPEVRAFAALELGHHHRVQGRLDEAQPLLESIPAELPQHPSAQMELAQLLSQRGDHAAAIALIEPLLAQQPEPQLQAQLGLLYQTQGDHHTALDLLRRALPQLTGELRGTARFGVGWSLYQLGELEAAWTMWRRGLDEDSLQPEQHSIYLRALERCARDLDDAERIVRLHAELVDADADTLRLDSRLALGRFHLDRGDHAAAREQVEGLEDNPDTAVALTARLLLGRVRLAEGQPLQALHLLDAALQLDPEGEQAAEVHFSRGSALAALDRWAPAAEAFAASLAQAEAPPAQAEALFYLAHSLLASGDTTAAHARFAALAAEYPASNRAPEALLYTADADFWAGELERARQAYHRLHARWPDSPQAPQALYGAGWSALQLEDEEAMTRYFTLLARDYPEHSHASEALMHLGDYHYNAGDHAEAQRLYEQLVKNFPEAPQAATARELLVQLRDAAADPLYTAGMEHFEAGDYAQAVALLEQVVEQYPDTPSEAAARCNIGIALQRMHNERAAIRVYVETIEALQDRPEEERARQFAQQHLARLTGD